MDQPDEEATQVDEEQCEDESSQKHAEAQPEETDTANAPVEYWGFPGETIHIHNVNLATLCLFLPMTIVPSRLAS